MLPRPLLILCLTVLLTVVAFPPFELPEAAYLFCLPILFWASTRPSWKSFLYVSFGAGWLSWLCILIWLRHVTWAGLIVLACVLALFFVGWAAMGRCLLNAAESSPAPRRLLAVGGIAAAWVVLEWVRGTIFSGFPWLTLAASQWERPVILQMLPYTGAAGLSFVLIFFNVAIVFYVREILRRRKGKKTSSGGLIFRLSPELYAAVALLLLQLLLYMPAATEAGTREPMFRVGIVQPNAPVLEHYDEKKIYQSLIELEEETQKLVQRDRPDFVLWPESALTLLPLAGDINSIYWTQQLAKNLRTQIVGGALAVQGKAWYNALYVIDPVLGVHDSFYAKRQLVPFGEYVPLKNWLPFLEQVVPYEDGFRAGDKPTLLTVYRNSQAWKIGGLICYEDIFPNLARDMVNEGAHWLAVVTNNGWFGEEGGAYQHAAHAVLRAAENRRPVVRCGNAGWSGWIDEHGHIRSVVTDDTGDIYFRGGQTLGVTRSKHWADGQLTFYTQHGDVFVLACALLLLGAVVSMRKTTDEQ